MKVIVTGAAGFIGFHVSKALLANGNEVLGLDDLNDYYAPALKQSRIKELASQSAWQFQKINIADQSQVAKVFQDRQPDAVIHLAAQAGVRYSLTNPFAYVQSNLIGHVSILEACRHTPSVRHLIYASSSSVYGDNTSLPYSENDRVDAPVSLYAATKKADELMSHVYAHLYRLPQTGLRFFTVYGPWGRPDMAYWLFTDKILSGQPIQLFNYGKLKRDFTYIDDVVEGVTRLLELPPEYADSPPHRVLNIGNHAPVELEEFVSTLESVLGMQAIIERVAMQPGDVHATFADISNLRALTGWQPHTPLREGLTKFADWYRGYVSGVGASNKVRQR